MPLVTTKIQWETDVMMSRINKTENMAGTVWKILDPLFAILTKKKKKLRDKNCWGERDLFTDLARIWKENFQLPVTSSML